MLGAESRGRMSRHEKTGNESGVLMFGMVESSQGRTPMFDPHCIPTFS